MSGDPTTQTTATLTLRPMRGYERLAARAYARARRLLAWIRVAIDDARSWPDGGHW